MLQHPFGRNSDHGIGRVWSLGWGVVGLPAQVFHQELEGSSPPSPELSGGPQHTGEFGAGEGNVVYQRVISVSDALEVEAFHVPMILTLGGGSWSCPETSCPASFSSLAPPSC